MKRQNRAGPALLGERPDPRRFSATELRGKVGGAVTVIDTRPRAVYERDAVAGAIHLPVGKAFTTYASYIIDPEKDDREIVVLAADEVQAAALRDRLAYVGIDNVVGYLTDFGDLRRTPVKAVTAAALKKLPEPYILDLRTEAEFRVGHIPGAHRLHAGRVMWHLDSLPRDCPVVTHCQTGARNTVVSSALRAAGFENVIELEGSYLGWQRAQTGDVAV